MIIKKVANASSKESDKDHLIYDYEIGEIELKIIKETHEVKRALYGDFRHKIKTFAILTAENPMGKALPPDENNILTNDLKHYCKNLHIQIIHIQGYFDIGEKNLNDKKNYGDTKYSKKSGQKRPEHSFILINPALNDVKSLASRYDQLSFFYGENYWGTPVKSDENTTDNIVDEHTTSSLYYYAFSKNSGEYKLIEQSRRIDNASDFDNFFSKYRDYKYSIYLDLFNEAYDNLNTIKDFDCLFEALDDSKTTKHKSTMRTFAYNGKLI